MTHITKLTFSALEAELIQNTGWILTKQSALQKLEELLAAQIPVIQDIIPPVLLSIPEITASRPKISRGEKYRELPWLMLDYPAVFTKRNVFALRTMFWWGHHFSVQLHLSGSYKQQFGVPVARQLKTTSHPFYWAVGVNEWEHYFEEDNYLPVQAAHVQGYLDKVEEADFMKVGLHFPLTDWQDMPIHLAGGYKIMFALLQ